MQTVHFEQPLKAFQWDEFRQEPSCGYEWVYKLYMDGDSKITEESQAEPWLSLSQLESFEEVEPAIMYD